MCQVFWTAQAVTSREPNQTFGDRQFDVKLGRAGKPIQASNFRRIFDQHFLCARIEFLCGVHTIMPLYFFYTMVQKKSTLTKNSNQRGPPDISCMLHLCATRTLALRKFFFCATCTYLDWVTSLPSLSVSVCLSVSLSLSLYIYIYIYIYLSISLSLWACVPHAQVTKHSRAWHNNC